MEEKKLILFLKGLVGVIALVAAFFFVKILGNPDDANGAINGMLRFTYIIFILTLIVAVVVWFKEIVTHPKILKQTLIFAGLFAVIVLVARFVFASDKEVRYGPTTFADASTSGWVDTGLYMFYILGAIALLTMFLSPLLGSLGSPKGGQQVELESKNEE